MLQKFFATSVTGSRASTGLLILRVIGGLTLATHGFGKVMRDGQFVMTSWMGPDAPVPSFFQFLAAFSEFFGGLALIVGLLTPLAALGIISTMAVAMFTAHAADPWVPDKEHPTSKEPALMYFLIAQTVLFAGAGKFSLDYLLFNRGKVAESVPATAVQR